MLKVSVFRGETDRGAVVLPLVPSTQEAFEKGAAPALLSEVARYITALRPSPSSIYVLVNAMGAGEFYGSNINGDYFTEASLIHAPDNWSGSPVLDRVRAKTWPYGFPTFYDAHPFAHHRNKDPSRAYGEVELAAWNPKMRRVELVVRVDKDKCEQFAGTGVWDKLHQGQHPDVSMGCKVPFDTCSICLDWDTYRKAQSSFDPKKHKSAGDAVLSFHKNLKLRNGHGIRGVSITRVDYCEHAKKQMNRILPDGRKVFVFNDYPRFFDISFVFIGADKTAKVMLKIAEGRRIWSLPSAELAEKLGYDEDASAKTASIVLYHGTRPSLIKQIRQEGLDPKYMGSAWEGAPEQRAHRPTISLSSTKEHAQAYAALGAAADAKGWVNKVKAVVAAGSHAPLRVELPDGFPIEQVVFGKGRGGFDEWHAHRTIPPKFIKEAQEDLLKTAFLGKAAKEKDGEIVKDVLPSQFAGKAVPILTANEPDLPRDLVDVLGNAGLGAALSTTAGLGIVLRPKEFQRIVLISTGSGPVADMLDERGVTFGRSKGSDEVPLGPSLFSPALAQLLLPLLASRSGLAPAVERRIVVVSHHNQKEKKAVASLSSPVLDKIGAAYNGYRSGLMELVTNAQELVARTAKPSDVHLRKLSEAPVEEVFTPLSVAYLKHAYMDELGDGTVKASQAEAGVERGLPSRNTRTIHNLISGEQKS